VLASVPGVGRRGAARLHDELGLETLFDLETAAHDGRLAAAGVGPKRLAGIRASLAERLARVVPPPASAGGPEPSLRELLDVDAEYRAKAARGLLPRIAPRRFNPQAEAWLPVLHTRRGRRHYTALFSNTARAHRVGATRDWVILYVDDGGAERRYTVVTARQGRLAGNRVVVGRAVGVEPSPGLIHLHHGGRSAGEPTMPP
jgi:hypothetical protein